MKKKPILSTKQGSPKLSKASDRSALVTQQNTKYTFDSFVVGACNRFAYAVAWDVAEAPAKGYNPLYIYGGVGLGKTHLMHAIENRIRQIHPENKILYTTSERFCNDYINAVFRRQLETFRKGCRNVDVILMEDVQFLARKEQTQEELFHLFNVLREANKQIILSSDRHPKDIPALEDRLRSRFEWGLMAEIQCPDLETRVAIVRKKALSENVVMPEEVITYLANRVESNVGELEGAFNRVVANAFLQRKPITLELTSEILENNCTK